MVEQAGVNGHRSPSGGKRSPDGGRHLQEVPSTPRKLSKLFLSPSFHSSLGARFSLEWEQVVVRPWALPVLLPFYREVGRRERERPFFCPPPRVPLLEI